MIDNEKLIERARLTPKDAPRNLIPLVLELANALEAAEKALGKSTVTPTGDEREAREAITEHLASCDWSEPQGEPSGAQVRAAVDAFMASQLESEDGPLLVHKNMIAALRAAGNAR